MKNLGLKWIAIPAAILGLLAWGQRAEAGPNDKQALFHLEAPAPKTGLDFHAAVHLDFLGYDRHEENLAGAGSQENNFTIRRARVVLTGILYEKITFFIQTGLESTDTLLMDGIMIYQIAPWVDVRAGQMKMPFSAERLESYLTNPFLERSLAANLELRRSRGVSLGLHPRNEMARLELGLFTGENMMKNNTDDHFEYVGRGRIFLNKIIPDFPGEFALAASGARGRRSPVREATTSFTGKTLNELTFFSPVPVNGYRTRWEADLSWRYQPLWLAAEWIHSEEERDHVRINLDTDGDGVGDAEVTRDLENLLEQGWKVSAVCVLTGEPFSERIVPDHSWGAVELLARYSTVTFDSQEEKIRGQVPGTRGREVSAASQALGRRSIDEKVRSVDAGLNWFIKPGFWIGLDVTWQWFDHSSTYDGNNPDQHSDINYRGRIAVAF